MRADLGQVVIRDTGLDPPATGKLARAQTGNGPRQKSRRMSSKRAPAGASTPKTILMVNCLDTKGGAAGITTDLFHGVRSEGHEAWLAVSRKTMADDHVLLLSDTPGQLAWAKACQGLSNGLAKYLGGNGLSERAQRFARETLAHPVRAFHRARGWEVFNYPGGRKILDRLPVRPGLIHCHNLHHGFFDLNHPLVLTLHDAWLLAGHCVHSFDCLGWRGGCGNCPGLDIYPSLERDGTARNFRLKQKIYAASRLYVTTPSRWLMDKVDQSMLAKGLRLSRVIPNGVDTGVFCPGDRGAARQKLGLPLDGFIVLFVAEDPRGNMWKDYATLKRAFVRLKDRFQGQALLLALGAGGAANDFDGDVRLLPFVEDPRVLADYYRAADVYAHAARAETFPTVILEAMACGTAVVATAVGGIPEQIQEGITGYLVGLGNDAMLAERLAFLGHNLETARAMGERAGTVALEQFSNLRMRADYLNWYDEVIEDFRAQKIARANKDRA